MTFFKTLSKNKIIYSYVIALMILPLFSYAQEKSLRDSEIVGLSLNNNRNDIKQILEKDYTISGFSEFKDKFNINNVETNEISQCYLFELSGKNAATTAFNNEFIAISLDPEENSQAILSIHRGMTFEKGKELIKNNFLKSIYEKYGTPNVANKNNDELYIWSDPSITPQASYGYLVNFANDLAYSTFEASGYTQQICSYKFKRAFDFFGLDYKILSKYRTIMLLKLRTNSDQKDIVEGFTLTIVDISKGLSSFKNLIDSTRIKVQKSKESTLKQKQQNEGPKL